MAANAAAPYPSDSTPPDLVLSMSRLIADSQYEIIADAGHISCVEQPEALTALIRTFIRSITN